jgi:hypothetical protein
MRDVSDSRGRTSYGLVIGLIVTLVAALGIIGVMAKIIRDFSKKLNSTKDADYIPDWSDEDAFDIDLGEDMGDGEIIIEN